MFVRPAEKKIKNREKSKIIEATEAKTRYLKEASALIDIRRFIISVNESIEKSSSERKKRMKSLEEIKKSPEKKVRKIISINS